MIHRTILNNERGATLLEYAFALSVLILVFVVAGPTIWDAGETRADQGLQQTETMIPCGTGMLGGSGREDECK